MIQIEPYPCANKRELETRERYWLEQLEANLNSQIPSRTNKEYYQDNRDKILTQRKQYHKNNKDKILAYEKQRYQDNKDIRTCVCGSEYDYGKSGNRNQHYRTQKHTEYVAALHEHLQELMCQ